MANDPNLEDEVTLEEVGPDLAELLADERLVSVPMTRGQLWNMASAVQLATRHPGFTGPAAQLAADGADKVFAALATTDPLARLAVQGWRPDHIRDAEGKPTGRRNS